MKCTITPALNQMRVDELVVEIEAGAMPEVVKSERAIASIRWDGEVGLIKYRSEVPGRSDIEYFRDPALLQTYLAAFREAIIKALDREQARLEEKAQALIVGPVEAERMS